MNLMHTKRCLSFQAIKVRQAPFGRALISLVHDTTYDEERASSNMYHARENHLTLWTSLANKKLGQGAFVHTFYGHNDSVLDFHWVTRIGNTPTRRLL